MRRQVEPDKICDKCSTILVHGKEEIFCDVCKEKLERKYPLRITIFFKKDIPTDKIDCCSWKCVAKYLKEFQ